MKNLASMHTRHIRSCTCTFTRLLSGHQHGTGSSGLACRHTRFVVLCCSRHQFLSYLLLVSQQFLEVGAREKVGEKQDEGGEGGGIMELGEEEVLDGEENRELLKRLSE